MATSPRPRTCRLASLLASLALPVWLAAAPGARAQDSGRLLATPGVVEIEGAGGGGLVPWAPVTGYGTRDSVGADAHDTVVYLPDFTLESAGAAVGLFERLELSYDHIWFDTRETGGRLGLGVGYRFHLDVAGAKLRLFGDLVTDQDRWWPEVSVGTQFKAADRHAVLAAVGARAPDGVDAYLAATKLFLAQSLLVDLTLRETEANQFGLLGFGGDRGGYSLRPEGSVALLVTRRLAVGLEFRTKPDRLRFASEGTAFDAFAAYFFGKHLSATLSAVALGPIVHERRQDGVYLSLVGGF